MATLEEIEAAAQRVALFCAREETTLGEHQRMQADIVLLRNAARLSLAPEQPLELDEPKVTEGP